MEIPDKIIVEAVTEIIGTGMMSFDNLPGAYADDLTIAQWGIYGDIGFCCAQYGWSRDINEAQEYDGGLYCIDCVEEVTKSDE